MGKLIRCMKCGGENLFNVGVPCHLGCQKCGSFIMQFDEDVVIECVKCKKNITISAGAKFDFLHLGCGGRLWKIKGKIEEEIKEEKKQEEVKSHIKRRDKKKEKVSAIVVCHNKWEVTRECIVKLKKTSIDEIIVVDNGSEDNTKAWAKTIVKIVYIRNQANLGCAIARNQGAKWAKNDWLFIIDNDQYVPPDIIERMMEVETDLVGVDHWWIDWQGIARPAHGGENENCAYVGSGGLLIKKEVFRDLGGYDERYAPAWYEDADFCFRARAKGYSVGWLEGSEIEHLKHQTIEIQKTFDSKMVKDKSKALVLEIWGKHLEGKGRTWKPIIKKKRFIVTKGKKPKVFMFVDTPGWAWDFKTKEIIKYLSDQFEFGVGYQSKGEVLPEGWDLYFTYEVNQVKHIPKELQKRAITGVTSHTYVNFPNWEDDIKAVKAIHANSRLLFEEIKGYGKTYYLPNGVNEKLFEFNKRDIKEDFTVGFVGKIARKGLNEYIRPACSRAKVAVKVIEGGIQRPDLIPHEEMPDFYTGIDCICIASDKDGTPNMLLEAAATGRTFIGNRIGNVPEFIKEGENGFLIEKRDIDLYAEKLKWLKTHRIECWKMGQEARRTVERYWTWKKMAENYRTMFWEVLTSV